MKIRLLLALFLLKTAFSTAQTNCAKAYLYEANIRSMVERGTSVWVGTDIGLVEIDRATRTVVARFDRNNSLLDGPVTALSVDADNALLVGTDKLWRTQDLVSWTKVLDAGAEIRDLHVQDDTLVWAATALGVWRLGKLPAPEFFKTTNSQLPNNWVNRVRSDQFGNAWLAIGQPFSQGGLLKIPTVGPWKFFKKPTSPLPQTSAVRDLLVDQNGSVWLAAQDAVLRLDTAEKWTVFDPEPNFGGDYNACSVSQKPTGEIVVGMENTVAERSLGGVWSNHSLPGLFSSNAFIFNTLAASDGSVWAGSNINGLVVFDGNSTQKVATSTEPLPLSPVTAMAESPAGKIWAGTSFGGVETLENGAWKFIDSLLKEQSSVQILDIQFDTDGLPVVILSSIWQQWSILKYDGTKFTQWTSGFSNFITGFKEKRRLRHAGNAWFVNTTRGLFRWENNALSTIDTSNSGIPTNQLTDMDVDSQGNLWITTLNKGLVFFDGNGFVRYDSATTGLPTDSLLSVSIGKDDFPFFSDTKGNLMHFSTAGLQVWKDTTSVSDSRILLLDVAPNGGVWINNKSGVTRFDPFASSNQWLAFSGEALPFVVSDGRARSLVASDGFTWVGKNSGIYKIDESCFPAVGTTNPAPIFGEIKAFPNPTFNWANVEFLLQKPAEIGLFLVNIAGKRVASTETQKLPAGENRLGLSLENLPPGIYFYEIMADGQRAASGKLVKI